MPPADLWGRQTPINNPRQGNRGRSQALCWIKRKEKPNQPHFPGCDNATLALLSFPRCTHSVHRICSNPSEPSTLLSPVPPGDPDQVVPPLWASVSPHASWGGPDGLRAPVCSATPALNSPRPSPCHPLNPLGALPLSPGASAPPPLAKAPTNPDFPSSPTVSPQGHRSNADRKQRCFNLLD